ncbi:ATP-dependent endonuclease [Paenibacillus profundus]|uniref:ATP-dependent endonuclease n=1 Tax=Paenibacillus profundus TaxID=1173085 RepID=A0ABS8YK18_9BACL|nr:ATP-dependent endonuclease [Paenibacillus profundus]MCE5169899.1 ATP-dependent endonuclease [Paenibacillus profundus]
MKISRIKVNNYRLLKKFELDLERELSVIIGKNNSGKTSLLSILDKFIGKRAATNAFSYDDFNIDFQKEIQKLVENETSDVVEDLNIGISLTIFIEYDESDNLANISKLMMDLDPKNNTVVIRFEYVLLKEDLLKIRSDYKKYSNKTITEFLKDNHKKYFKIFKKALRYDRNTSAECDNEFIDLGKENVLLEKIINFKLISAKRNVTNNDSDRTLSVLSSKYYEKKDDKENKSEKIQDFKDTLSDTDAHLDKIYEGLFADVIGKVKKFGGIKEGESVIKIASALQHRELLKGNTTVMYDHNAEHSLPENYNGLGYLNLIAIIFEIEILLSEFRMESKENEAPADINLLFIEEPEAHTHPQMQYVFIKNIKEILREASIAGGGKSFNLQTAITTHSSHITSESDFNDIKYFYKSSNNQVSSKNLKDLQKEYGEDEEKYFKFLKQYLTLYRAELFFADKAIFIEGDTERILLPAMMKKIDQEYKDNPLLSQNISIVEVGAYSQVFEKFINFIGLKSIIITDIDSVKKVDGNGKRKEEIAKCRVKEANTTTNSSLKYFFAASYDYYKEYANKETAVTTELEKFVPSQTNDLDFYLSLNKTDKILRKDAELKQWVPDENGNMLVIYQISDKDSNGKEYCARSFEDSFFHLNRQFIIDNKEHFKSLKKIKHFEEEDKDSYFLAENCVGKKPNFAMEILLNSKEENGLEFSNWEIPLYIKEGLLWLKNN